MNIATPFIKKPIMTSLVMITVMVFGYLAYNYLPVSDLPNVDFPTIQVTVSNPGSNPQTMASTCATPLEREFMTIDGINSITSNSVLGTTTLILQFSLDKSMDTASLDVEAAINRAEPNLPNDLPYNPTYQKVNPTATPILYYAIYSDSMSLSKLYDYANTNIGQRLSMIEGISEVQTYGAAYAARVQVDPNSLASMNLDIDDVASSIEKSNVEYPTGTLYGDKNEYTIDVDGQLYNADGYSNIVIKSANGAIVKVNQVGKALDSLKNDKYYLHFKSKDSDKECVVLAIQKQTGENTVKVAKRVENMLPQILKQLPASLVITKLFDQSDFIISSVNDVKFTLILAFILVVLIIFIYLGKLIDTIIPTIVLPISILGTFTIMTLFNFSIDILSMLAITLSIGFLVDDAIVVLENNVRHSQMGKNAMDASIDGSKEISITVLSMTLCLVSVFIPLIFMSGVIGRLFKEFAITIASAVMISGLISLSLTPLLCSRFIATNHKKKKNFIEKFSDLLNDKLLFWYKTSLEKLLHYKKTALFVGFACTSFAILLFVFLPKEFLPNEDMGFLQGFCESQDGTSPYEMARYQAKVADVVSQNKAVKNMVAVSSVTMDNEGMMFINLVPYKKRAPLQNTINELMENLYPIAGVNSYVSTVPLINLQQGTGAKALYQYSLTSISQELLNDYATKMLDAIRTTKGFAQVSTDLQINQPQLNFEILRDKASYLNISASKIETYLMHAYTDKKISTINSDINQYDVIIETLPNFYKDPSIINQLYIKSDNNNLVPFQEVVKLSQTVGPLSVNHLNGLPSATISFNLQKDMPLSKAVSTLENLSQKVLPASISGQVLGEADVFKKSFQNLNILIIITIFIIYVILGILYESLIHPITVMSTLAPASFGGLLGLFIFREVFSLYSFVGLLMLLGIVMKNGIMLVDFANENLKKSKSIKDSIFEACLARFRPIMMTSIAAFMGALPIALAIGTESAKSRQSLGIVITFGLIVSQILTLYLTPITYILLQELSQKIKEKFFKKSLES